MAERSVCHTHARAIHQFKRTPHHTAITAKTAHLQLLQQFQSPRLVLGAHSDLRNLISSQHEQAAAVRGVKAHDSHQVLQIITRRVVFVADDGHAASRQHFTRQFRLWRRCCLGCGDHCRLLAGGRRRCRVRVLATRGFTDMLRRCTCAHSVINTIILNSARDNGAGGRRTHR